MYVTYVLQFVPFIKLYWVLVWVFIFLLANFSVLRKKVELHLHLSKQNYRVVQYLLWTSNFRGILKQYWSLSSGIGALFVPFVLLFLWPIMWDVQWGAGRLKLYPFQNLSLGFVLKIFLKFRKFQLWYSYKIYSCIKESVGLSVFLPYLSIILTFSSILE